MTKQTLIGIVQKSLANNGLSVGKREAAAVVDDVFASIKSEAETNGFSYPKFGKFYTALVLTIEKAKNQSFCLIFVYFFSY